jgi:dTDP-4-dehydrorhamnose 3,5-epimerase
MEFQKTSLKGAFLIKPQVSQDERGFFLESYSKKKFQEAGIEADFVQDNHSLSVSKGVLRGLHFQNPEDSQAKLVRVTKGAVYDVIVDLRKDSETFGKWVGFELTADNFYMLYVPRGFAHGFVTLEDYTEFQYKCDNFYNPANESGIIWNDPDLKIYWPIENPILSEKDKKLPFFKDLKSPF